MKIATTISSERGKPVVKTANESIQIDITINREIVGHVYVDYKDDRADGCEVDEWVISYARHADDIDPEIIAQGHI